MKRYIAIIATLFCVATTTTQAQELFLGVKAGLNISSAGLHGNDVEGRDQYRAPRFGFSGGFSAEYKFKKPISLSGEILYSQQGVKYKYPNVSTGGEATVTHKYSYINIPLLFNYYFVENVPISLNLGIQPGFMVSESSSTKYTNGSTSEEWDYAYGWDVDGYGNPNGNGYNMFDLSVPIGFTYTLSSNISFDVRYCIGLLNVLNQSRNPDIKRDFRSTNNNCTVSVGYKF